MKTCSLYIKKFSFMWLSRDKKEVFTFSKYLGHTLAFFTIQSIFHFFQFLTCLTIIAKFCP